jgi:hypothetical protein
MNKLTLTQLSKNGVADHKYEKTTQIPDFFVETLIAGG